MTDRPAPGYTPARGDPKFPDLTLHKPTSSERLTALVEESDALARIVAKNPSAPVSLLRVLSRSEDEATRKNVILNPFTPYDVLSELENQFTELFVNNPALESYNSMKL